MPAWTTPKTWQTGEALTASDMNAHIRDNLDHLHTRMENEDDYTLNESADYTTTSTSFVNVDGTKLSLTITTTKDNALVLVGFHGVAFKATSGQIYFDVAVDGTRNGGDDGFMAGAVGSIFLPIVFARVITVASAGAHTFALQWKVSTGSATLYAGAGTTSADFHPQFWVKEL